MSLYRRGRVWWMDFHFHGQRIQETAEMRSITRAREVQEKRKQELKDGTAGIRKQQQPRLLSVAAQEWQEAKMPAWSPRMADIAKNSTNHLLPVLGKKLLVDIEASDISKYQKARLANGASNRTVNIEVGVPRQIMKKYGTWARVQPDVNTLPERQDWGRALSAEEESALLLECGRSRSHRSDATDRRRERSMGSCKETNPPPLSELQDGHSGR